MDFYLDGELQATDTSPLRLDLDTTRSTNASHTLLAKAYAGSTLLGSSLPRTAQAANTITHDTDEFEPNNSSPMPCPSRFAPPAMAASAARRCDWFQLTLTTPGILTLGLTFSKLDRTVLGAPDMKLMGR